MLSIILFSLLLLCVTSMFLYLNRKIALNDSSIQNVDMEQFDKKMASFKERLSRVGENVTNTEKFTSQIHNDTQNNLVLFKNQQEVFLGKYHAWEETYKLFQTLANDIEHNKTYFEEIKGYINKSEEQGYIIQDCIHKGQGLQVELEKLMENIEGILPEVQHKGSDFVKGLNEQFNLLFEKNKQLSINLEQGFAQKLGETRNVELESAKHAFHTLYKEQDLRRDNYILEVRNSLKTLYHVFEDKGNSIINNNQDRIDALTENSKSIYVDLSKKINQEVINYSDRIASIGEDIYKTVVLKLDGTEESINGKINEFSHNFIERVEEIETSNKARLDNVMQKNIRVGNSIDALEDYAVKKVEEINNHISNMHGKIEADYKGLDNTRGTLVSLLSTLECEINNMKEQITSELSTKQQEHISNLQAFIEKVEADITQKTNAKANEIQNMYKNSKGKIDTALEEILQQYQEEISKNKDIFVTDLQAYRHELDIKFQDSKDKLESKLESLDNRFEEYQGEISKNKDIFVTELQAYRHELDIKFQGSKDKLESKLESLDNRFEEYQGEISKNKDIFVTDLQAYRHELDIKFQDSKDRLESKLESLDNRFEEYQGKFTELLEKEGTHALEHYNEKLIERSAMFDGKIKEMSLLLTSMKEVSQEDLGKIEILYTQARHDAENKLKDYKESLNELLKQSDIIEGKIQNTERLFKEFNKKSQELEMHQKNAEEFFKQWRKDKVQIENEDALIQAVFSSNKKLQKDANTLQNALIVTKNELHMAINSHRNTLKEMKQIDKKVDAFKDRAKNIDLQKETIDMFYQKITNLQETQEEVLSAQKDLKNRSNEYQVQNATLDTIQNRSVSLMGEIKEASTAMKSWKLIIDKFNNDLQKTTNKYESIKGITEDIEVINNEIPKVAAKIEEFKEIKETIPQYVDMLGSSIEEAEENVEKLRVLHSSNDESVWNKDNTKKKQRVITQAIKKQVIDLKTQKKWDDDTIARVLKLQKNEVALITDKALLK